MDKNSILKRRKQSNKRRFSRTIIILSNDEWVYVPSGVDPGACRRQYETRIATMNPAPAIAMAMAA